MRDELVCKAGVSKSEIPFFGGGPLCFDVDSKWEMVAKNYLKNMKLGDVVRLTIEPWSEDKTSALNRFFHLLLNKWWKSGTSSAEDLAALKVYVKSTYGVPPKYVTVKGEHYVYLKSWADYTINEACKAIDGMIEEMILLGVDYDIVYNEWGEFER